MQVSHRRLLSIVSVAAVLFLFTLSGMAQSESGTVPDQVFQGLQWRLIGPFRGGRSVAVSGVPGSSTTFYFGSVGGGIWKTADAGTVWNPIFDKQKIASIGAIAVAPSDPNVIYAGTGESDIRLDLGSGDGVYKSTDAGATWQNVGLKETRQISRIVVDPTDPNTVYVGALGHAYGPNSERGVYKSTDGGATWTHVLDKGPDLGIADLAIAKDNPKVLFAAVWNAHRPPWSIYGPLEGSNSNLYRSLDAGATWTLMASPQFPAGNLGRIGVAVSSDGKRVYALIEAQKGGLYRSDDGGDTWSLANADPRITSRAWYFQGITVDPENRDVIYMPNVALYKSDDGGKTITILRGAPGGDDYHQLWVDPKDSAHLLLGTDQGTTISLDHGVTWTSWYNEPTAQMYHVITDNQFPYIVYGAQQDSGAYAVVSRTDHQIITSRDFFLPGNSESGYMAPDPNNPNILYMSSTNGTTFRVNLKTELSQTITPWPMRSFQVDVSQMKYREPWTPVLLFSAFDHKTLYMASQFVMKTMDGGLHWDIISPDLTGAVPSAKVAKSDQSIPIDLAVKRGYGLINALATSPLTGDVIWAGSDSGLLHITRDAGKTWKDITPKEFGPWSKVSIIEASHFDPAVAYVAVDRHETDDQKPYIYRTDDYGATWKLIVDGIRGDSFAWSVREDTKQRNLLFAGTELGVYVSFNRGDSWQPLQLNLPVVSVRDLTIHGDDLVVATHGRSIWILDDIGALREAVEASKSQDAYLFHPATTVRIDNDSFIGTPLPPEEPTGKNPPDGAIIDYYLGTPAREVQLEMFDSAHHLVRRFSSTAMPPHVRPPQPIAERWFPKPQVLDVTAGMHRFIWNLTWAGSGTSSSDDDDDARVPRGPRVIPGVYEVRLTVDEKALTSSLKVTMDPRSAATPATLALQMQTANAIFLDSLQSRKALAEINSVQEQLAGLKKQIPMGNAALNAQIGNFETAIKALTGRDDQGLDSGNWSLTTANAGLTAALGVVEEGERVSPAQALEVYHLAKRSAAAKEEEWNRLKAHDLADLNKNLQAANVTPVAISEIQEQVDYLMTR